MKRRRVRLSRRQRGRGLARFLRVVPQLIRRVGRFTRRTGLRSGKLLKRGATKKNLKRLGLAGATAAATGAASGVGHYVVDKLIR